MNSEGDQHFGLSKGAQNTWSGVHWVKSKMAHIVYVAIWLMLRSYETHVWDSGGLSILV